MGINDFHMDDFQLINHGKAGSGHKKYLGKRSTCRFCGRDGGSASFKHKAHAIPEFLGNHSLILNSECDNCNAHFGKTIEPHLNKYTHPFRSISGITNKKRKTPKYSDERIESLNLDRHERNLNVKLIDDNAVKWDDENRIISMSMEREPFIPYLAHKALCKIAVSTIANEDFLPIFEPTFEWLNPHTESRVDIAPALLVETIMPGARYTECMYRLYFRNTRTFPHCLFWLAFGNFSLLIFIPTWLDFEPGVTQDEYEIPFVPDQRTPEDIREFGPQSHIKRDFSIKTPTIWPHQVFLRYEKSILSQ